MVLSSFFLLFAWISPVTVILRSSSSEKLSDLVSGIGLFP